MGATPTRFGLVLAVAAVVVVGSLAFHSRKSGPVKPKEAWKSGYWVWGGEVPAESPFKADLLYVEVRGSRWPDNLPESPEYMIVRRIEPGVRLTQEVAAALAENYKALVADAGLARIGGLQIDYDSPVSKLESYGQFLRWVRRDLPPETRLSITALLDWFRPDRSIADVLTEVDEFVPQFYDAGATRESAGIAEPVDAQRWASIFDKYTTPYRIGISTFGRVARRRAEGSKHSQVHFFRDASPLDFAASEELTRSVRTTTAGEIVVHYDVRSSIENRPELQAGDVVEITLPTEASVRGASEAARQFGGYCAGVIFFRWPTQSETVTLAPDDVQRITSGAPMTNDARIEEHDAVCLERRCVDLYLNSGSAIHAEDRSIRIHARGPLELFLPDGPLRLRAGRARAEIVAQVPAYSGFGKIYLGRAISSGPIHFEMSQP